ncbi:MAG TPA: DinB family protein [Anaerolineales bacterium]|nr:DinB family protein [Anaerolineales bacterium]
MPPHLLVNQLRFARSEFVRGLDGVTAEEARRRFEPMNCISWIVGHLANQETRYWLRYAQGIELRPDLQSLAGYGSPPSTPELEEMWAAWREITATADPYLDTLTPELLQVHPVWNGRTLPESLGTLVMRVTYHYWYHTGEASAIRQQLGHVNLPDFVGDMDAAIYYPE